MAKRKIDLDKIPELLEKITSIIDKDIDELSNQKSLTEDESKRVIAYANTLTTIYKDYRAQIIQIEKDLKVKSKEDIMSIIKAEAS